MSMATNRLPAVLSVLVLGCGSAADSPVPAADSGGHAGRDTGEPDDVPVSGCVYGSNRSDASLDVSGSIGDILGDGPLTGVQVLDCETGLGQASGQDGTWTVATRDADFVTLLARLDGALPARWVFDPRVEGSGGVPYQQYMLWSDAAGAIMAEIGVTRDADAVVVMVDAVDPQSREMLSDVVVGTVPAAGAYMRISLEGRPEQSNTTNGLHNVAGLNVPAGVVSVTVDPGPGRTCRVPGPIEVPAGGLLAVTAYCSQTGR